MERRAREAAELGACRTGWPPSPEVLEGMENEGRSEPGSGFKSYFSHFLAVRPWAAHRTSLSLFPHP